MKEHSPMKPQHPWPPHGDHRYLLIDVSWGHASHDTRISEPRCRAATHPSHDTPRGAATHPSLRGPTPRAAIHHLRCRHPTRCRHPAKVPQHEPLPGSGSCCGTLGRWVVPIHPYEDIQTPLPIHPTTRGYPNPRHEDVLPHPAAGPAGAIVSLYESQQPSNPARPPRRPRPESTRTSRI